MTQSKRNVIRAFEMGRCLVVVAVALGGGCSRAKQSSQVVTMEGRVEKISLTSDATGEIAVLYRNKEKQEIIGTATVTNESEVMINGVLGKLADIKEGERIRGEVVVTRNGDKRTQRVLKIYVDRAEPVKPNG
jgi:predicted lipase